MSTYESVIKKLSYLAPADLQVIDLLADRLLQHTNHNDQPIRRAAAHYSPLTEDQWIEKLDAARQHIEEGKGVDGNVIHDRMMKKYHVS